MRMCRHYIGLDAHSKNSFFVVMDSRGKIRRRVKVPTTEAAMLEVVRSLDGSKALALEETGVSQWVYLLLKDEVTELVVCDPAANPKNNGAKTDFIDAAELAHLLRVGRLKPVFHSADAMMAVRTLVSGYIDVNQEIVRTKNRYKALFRQSAQPTSGGGFYDQPELIFGLPGVEQRFVASQLYRQISLLVQQRARYKKKFHQNLRRFPEARLLDSIPGLGPVRVNTVMAVVVTPYRFPTKYKFHSYASLVRHHRISDGREYGRKRALGSAQLRGVFKDAALSAIRSDNAFRRKYRRMIAQGSNDKAARNGVARAVASTVLGVWKSGKRYDDNHREVRHHRSRSARE